MSRIQTFLTARLSKWLEPQLFQPFVFGVLISLSLSEFVRGALTLSLLPTYGKTVLGFAVEWTALALSIHYLADNVLRSPAGWIADKFGQRTVLLIGFVIATGAVFWMMNAKSVPMLIASLAVYGFGVTPMWPAAISGIGLATPEKSRAEFMGYMYIFWLAGTGLGPVLINLIVGGTYQTAFWLLIGVEILAFALVWILVRRPVTVVAVDMKVAGVVGAQVAEGRDATVSRAGSNAEVEQDGVDADVIGEGPAMLGGGRPAVVMDAAYWRSLWLNVKGAAFLFPGMFAQTFAVASLIPILSLYAKVILHLSGAMYSTILVSGGGLTILLLVPAGRLVDKFGARRFLVTGFIAAGVALGIYPFVHTLWTTFLAVGILGICYAFILPSWNSVLDKSIDRDKKGTLWGVFMTVEGLGSAVGPYLGGLVWDTISPRAPFLVSAAVIFIMGLLYVVLPIDARHRPRQGGEGVEAVREARPGTPRGSCGRQRV